MTGPVAELRTALAGLRAALGADPGKTALSEAEHAGNELLPAMAALRAAADNARGHRGCFHPSRVALSTPLMTCAHTSVTWSVTRG